MFAPSISVKPNFFTTFVTWVDSTPTPRKSSNGLFQPLSRLTHGLISKKANGRIKTAIDWLLAITKDKQITHEKTGRIYDWRINFITLTLSSKQVHSDNEIKSKLLNQFLVEIRKYHGCTNFLWRAESQANGNIHFHICCDVFIPWRDLRTRWNRIQNKLGYVDRFTLKTGKVDPNSTDIHSVQKVRNLSAYLAKYCGKNAKGYTVLATKAMAKNPTFAPFKNISHCKPKVGSKFFRQIHGNLWGLSQQLSKLKSAMEVIDCGLEEEIQFIQREYPHLVKWYDFARVYLVNYSQLLTIGCNRIANTLYQYYSKTVNTC